MRVLVTEGGSGQGHASVSVVRALAVAGHDVAVTVSGRFSTAAWSRHCTRRFTCPPARDERYVSSVQKLVRDYDIGLVMPTSDMALVALGLPGRHLVDKAVVAQRAQAAHLPGAASRTFSDGASLLASAPGLDYPVAVKSATKDAHQSFAVRRADSSDDLAGLGAYRAPIYVEQWITGEQTAVSGVIWGGRLRAVVHQRYVRTWPPGCGVACFAYTIPPDPELEARIIRLLDGYDGLFQCQFIGGRLHDVNPRAYGSIALAVQAGVNLPDIVAGLTGGQDVGSHAPLRARHGVYYRWLEGDLRHLLSRWRSGETGLAGSVRGLKPTRGTAHPLIVIADPGPSVARLAYALGRGRS